MSSETTVTKYTDFDNSTHIIIANIYILNYIHDMNIQITPLKIIHTTTVHRYKIRYSLD